MSADAILHAAERLSTWVGKAFAWLIVARMTVGCVEVFKRYALNAPTAWIYDVNNMMYGTLFMMCGAYTLAQDGHVRGDFLYGSMKPRTQAALDLAIYLLFFLPGIAALVYAGYDYAADSWRIREHSNVTAEGPPVYHLKTGEWPSRLKDVSEIDVVEEQLAHSELVDEEARQAAIERAHQIDEAARQ